MKRTLKREAKVLEVVKREWKGGGEKKVKVVQVRM